jgi:flagellar basal body P-ring protein FlgI
MRTIVSGTACRAFPISVPFVAASLALFCAIGLTVGATDKAKKDSESSDRKEPKTIGDIVSVAGLSAYPVEGVGLVVGLENSGSDPLPSNERGVLLLDMQKRGIANAEEILRSPTTALVKVRARIPPAARSCKSAGCWCYDKSLKRSSADALRVHKGDTFDIEVESPMRDGTTSLNGGWLLECFLFETMQLPVGTTPGHVRAKAMGPVLVSGGLDGDEANAANLKRGRVLGGGVATEDRGFALVTDSDRTARWAIQIANRINERFPTRTREGKAIAEPKDGQRVLLRIPLRYRQNMARYLDVLRHMPLTQDASQEADRIERYAEELKDPSKARIAALRLEGIGARAAEPLKQALLSPDPDVRFFAAESLAYLDDAKAAEALAQSARDIPEYRAHALAALSSLDEPISPLTLHELMAEANSVELRYGAFRALRSLDPENMSISGETVGDELFLHHVSESGTPLIHMSSRDRAEIVLFGSDLQFETPLVLKVGNNIILKADAGSDHIKVSRFASGEPVRNLTTTLQIRDVIRRAVALGASYPDIVGLLLQADRQHNLPGQLEVDKVPDPTLLVTRLQRVSSPTSKANENVAMPNLFRWTDSRKSEKDRPESMEEVAAADMEKAKTGTEKPSLWERMFRRSAN